MGLTMLRLVLLPLFLWLILAGQGRAAPGYRYSAIGVLGVMAVTDKLDGYLARRLHQTSHIGALLDPVADKLLIACSVLLLSFDSMVPGGYAIPKPVFIAVYGKDVIVAMGTVALLYAAGRVSIAPRPLGKLSTFLQLVMILATLLSPEMRRSQSGGAHAAIKILWWLVVGVAAASCVDYLIAGTRQFAAHRAQRNAILGR
jgi:CDP-diacylglycerol--glycerol-3-phosphate 3-phosphatidyltransferase